MDIFLNIYDLFKIGTHLKLDNTTELFSKNLVKLKVGQNGITIPVINFKKSPYKFCPFLINDVDHDFNLKGFCSLHPYIKPLVCILAPVSKVYSPVENITSYSFIKPTENCPGLQVDKNVSVKEAIEPVINEIKYEERFFSCLESIIHNKISDYQTELYHFDLEKDFDLIQSEIESIFLAN